MNENNFSLQLAEISTFYEVCQKLLKTPHYARMGEQGMHIIIARAKALDIHPIEALNGGFYSINGKVGMSTEMMAALVRRRGHSITKDPKSNAEFCTLKGKRKDSGDEWTCTFTREDAIAAQLWNTATWKKYPAVMLYNRCMSMLFRQLFPDLSLGVGYTPDEVDEIAKVNDYKNAKEADCEVLDDKCISTKQVSELIGLLINHSDIYSLIMKQLAEKDICALDKLPLSDYEKLLEHIKKLIEKKQEKK